MCIFVGRFRGLRGGRENIAMENLGSDSEEDVPKSAELVLDVDDDVAIREDEGAKLTPKPTSHFMHSQNLLSHCPQPDT